MSISGADRQQHPLCWVLDAPQPCPVSSPLQINVLFVNHEQQTPHWESAGTQSSFGVCQELVLGFSLWCTQGLWLKGLCCKSSSTGKAQVGMCSPKLSLDSSWSKRLTPKFFLWVLSKGNFSSRSLSKINPPTMSFRELKPNALAAKWLQVLIPS